MQILQSRAGPSTLGFSPDMPMAYPPLHSSQLGLIRAGLSGLGSSSDLHRRTINSQLTPMTGGFKEPTRVSLIHSQIYSFSPPALILKCSYLVCVKFFLYYILHKGNGGTISWASLCYIEIQLQSVEILDTYKTMINLSFDIYDFAATQCLGG